MPDIATIHMAAAGANAVDLDFWDDVYGFSYRPIRERLQEQALKDAFVAPVDAAHMLTDASTVRVLDLAIMRPADVEFSTAFALEASSSVGPSCKSQQL